MSNDIGYGASAIKAGEVKYQQSLVDLMRQAATKKPANDSTATTPAASQPPSGTGTQVDVKA